MTGPFLAEFQWHAPDRAYAAAFWRDGQPWTLGGALADLCGAARNLVIEGENFLMGGRQLPVPDREWLFGLLDTGDSDDEMYAALRAAGGRA